MTNLTTSKKFKIYKEVRRYLVSEYPYAFPKAGHRPPLKVGILKDILSSDQCTLTAGKIRVFLSIWTRSTAYLKSVINSDHRIDLVGNNVGGLDSSHKSEAKKKIVARRKRRLKHLTK